MLEALCAVALTIFVQLFLKFLFSHTFFLYIYNHFHNVFRLFDVLPNFTFIVSETMRDYYL